MRSRSGQQRKSAATGSKGGDTQTNTFIAMLISCSGHTEAKCTKAPSGNGNA